MEYHKPRQKLLLLRHLLQVDQRFIIEPLYGFPDQRIIPGNHQRMIHIVNDRCAL